MKFKATKNYFGPEKEGDEVDVTGWPEAKIRAFVRRGLLAEDKPKQAKDKK